MDGGFGRDNMRYVAVEALAAGRWGIAAVSRSTEIARSMIGQGLREKRGQVPDAAPGLRAAKGRRTPVAESQAAGCCYWPTSNPSSTQKSRGDRMEARPRRGAGA